MEHQTSLPRHSKVIVNLLAVEELLTDLCEILLHVFIKDDLVPCRLLNLLIQLSVLVPVTVIHVDPRLLLVKYVSCGFEKLVGEAGVGVGTLLVPTRFFQNVLENSVAELDVVHDEELVSELVVVSGVVDDLAQVSRASFSGVRRHVPSPSADAVILEVDLVEGIAEVGKADEVDVGAGNGGHDELRVLRSQTGAELDVDISNFGGENVNIVMETLLGKVLGALDEGERFRGSHDDLWID